MQPVGDNFYGNNYYQSMFDFFSMMGKAHGGGRTPVDFARSSDFRHRKRSTRYIRKAHKSHR